MLPLKAQCYIPTVEVRGAQLTKAERSSCVIFIAAHTRASNKRLSKVMEAITELQALVRQLGNWFLAFVRTSLYTSFGYQRFLKIVYIFIRTH